MRSFITSLILILSAFLVSCNTSKEENGNQSNSEIDLNLPQLDSRFPLLSAQAQNQITSWQYFKEFENDLKRINQGNVRDYRAETERMVAVSDSLLKNIPEDLNTNSISSRMRVLNVRVKLLDETLHQPTVKTDVITENLKETNTAFSNLIIQINELFEKQRIDEMTRLKENMERAETNQTRDSL
ncbi:MAG: hypothetical protein NXH73_07060 [Flavobacteriaceae bacterium]|nr:hypothetical protein [Flavobacteriaceae bacterium]